MIEKIAEFLKLCPHLDGRVIGIGFLGEEMTSCSVETGKGASVLKRYTDGGCVKSQSFIFSLREAHTKEVETNLRATRLCTDIENWIAEQEELRNLPKLDAPKTAISIRLSNSFHLTRIETLDARYEAEIEVVWYDTNEN